MSRGGGGMRGGGGTPRSRSTTPGSPNWTVNWEAPKLNSYEGIDPDDFFSALPSDYRTSGKPLLVYVTTEMKDAAQKLADVDANVLQDEHVALGARFFRAVTVKGDRVAKGHPHWKTLAGKELPRLIVVDARGAKLESFEGKDLDASDVFKAMEKAAARTYKADLDKAVHEVRDALELQEQLATQRALVVEQKKTATKPSDLEKLVAEEARLTAALEGARKSEAEVLARVEKDRKVARK